MRRLPRAMLQGAALPLRCVQPNVDCMAHRSLQGLSFYLRCCHARIYQVQRKQLQPRWHALRQH